MATTLDDDSGTGRNRTTVDRVSAQLRAGILNSRFAPGQRLIEADLTRELSVSRGPLREAFGRLAAEGLIELVPNRGALVRRLTFAEMSELFEIRTELEALAARLAAECVDDRKRRFEDTIALIWSDEPRLSSAAYLEENKQFHDAVVAASGNTQLAVISRQLQLPLIMSQLGNALAPEILRESVCEHRLIADAILAGDSAEADRSMRRHLDRAAAFVRNMPETIFRFPE